MGRWPEYKLDALKSNVEKERKLIELLYKQIEEAHQRKAHLEQLVENHSDNLTTKLAKEVKPGGKPNI